MLRLRIEAGAPGQAGEGQGPVTALSQNLSSSRLLVGFASGRVTMWQLPSRGKLTDDDGNEGIGLEADDDDDSDQRVNAVATPTATTGGGDVKQKAGTLLRIVDDAHQERQSIIVCAFATLPTVAISVDSGGSVFQMSFTYVLEYSCGLQYISSQKDTNLGYLMLLF